MSDTAFIRTKLYEPLPVKHIVSLHYFEFSKDFSFEGEKHDFWEFVYVDRGELAVFADTEGYLLKQGDMIFHKPNEFHGVWANHKIAPNVIIISFVCTAKEMAFFENKIVSLTAYQQELLAQIIKNGFAAFKPPFDDHLYHTLHRRDDAPIGAEQLIKLHLELLLIDLLSQGDEPTKTVKRQSSAIKSKSEANLAMQMCSFMKKHICDDLTLEQIYKTFHLSRSHALNLFKEQQGISIMRYYRELKIEQAKQLLRSEQYTITEIANKLKYSSVHSFSRDFKAIIHMSPTEYLRTVFAKSKAIQ
ncbi:MULTISPECIES: AraC family transcriptional regulator [unclassified Paenibacillus]|uniref:AraC family transcriptional regulator n=1 Tax=unclassified Paenibacillus TaxID=185978 RepID=UPI002F4018A9